MTHAIEVYALGACFWHERHLSPCRIVDRDALVEISCRVWMPGKEAILHFRAKDLRSHGFFHPAALRIWKLLLCVGIEQVEIAASGDADSWFDLSKKAAHEQGGGIFAEMAKRHATRMREERERAVYAYNARLRAIGRIGLPAVRERRRKRLDADHRARMAQLDGAEACMPDLVAILLLRVDETSANAQ